MIVLNYMRVWHLVGLGLVLIVIFGCLVPSGSVPQLGMNDKLEHMIAYFGLALCYGGLMEPRRYPYLAVGLLALGGSIEIAQGLMGWGRDADWRDFYADALGAALGLSLCMAGLRHWPRWVERWLKPR